MSPCWAPCIMPTESGSIVRIRQSLPSLTHFIRTKLVFTMLVSRLLYALSAWNVLVSAGQAGRIDAILKRADKWGFSKDIVTLNELLVKCYSSLFQKMQSPVHCLNSLLPSKRQWTTSWEISTVNTFYHSVILMFLSIHLSVGGCSLELLSLYCHVYTRLLRKF